MTRYLDENHGWGLVEAILIALPGGYFPGLVATFMEPHYLEAGLDLPHLTLLLLSSHRLAWLLPIIVVFVWACRFMSRNRPERDRTAFTVAWVGTLLLGAVSILAAWVPYLSASGAIG